LQQVSHYLHAKKLAVFWQLRTSLRGTRDTLALLAHKTLHFIAPGLWPPNSPDITQLTVKSGASHWSVSMLKSHNTRC